MRIGIDLDNTIICYDALFPRLARERALPVSDSATKQSIRDALRRLGREDDWTELQGIAYGPRLGAARPFPGVRRAIRTWIEDGVEVSIVSHKTRYPYRGPQYDLQAAARSWLHQQGLIEWVGEDRVFLEPTREAKLRRIERLEVDVFIDDLPEFLTDSTFPATVLPLLFDPHAEYRGDQLDAFQTWDQLQRHVPAAPAAVVARRDR